MKKPDIRIVLTWDTESCGAGFERNGCYQRDWVEATHRIEETCERHGIPATFMVNFGEIDFWRSESPSGEDIVREMADRGHDVQLHIHTSWAAWLCAGTEPKYVPEKDIYIDDGLRKFPAGDKDTPWTQRFFIHKGMTRLESITGRRPVFYRDRNYDIDAEVARALWDEGILADGTLGYGQSDSSASRTPGGPDASFDTVPDRAYYPDPADIRIEGKGRHLPILEIPNTTFVGQKCFQRFQFTYPASVLAAEFDKWHEKHKYEQMAILCFLSHQKAEIYDKEVTRKPFRLSKHNSLENMETFFQYIADNYKDKGVRFCSAREAIMDFRKLPFRQQNTPPQDGD